MKFTALVPSSYDVVKHWCRQFNLSRLSIYDEPRSGRPASAQNEEMVAKVEEMVFKDSCVCIDTIGKTLGISHGSVCDILHNQLNMNKVGARWVSRTCGDSEASS